MFENKHDPPTRRNGRQYIDSNEQIILHPAIMQLTSFPWPLLWADLWQWLQNKNDLYSLKTGAFRFEWEKATYQKSNSGFEDTISSSSFLYNLTVYNNELLFILYLGMQYLTNNNIIILLFTFNFA